MLLLAMDGRQRWLNGYMGRNAIPSPLPSPPPPSPPQRFNPKFANAEMRSRLSDGHPEDPLIIYVGRLGAEKRLRDLKGVLQRCAEGGGGGRHTAAAAVPVGKKRWAVFYDINVSCCVYFFMAPWCARPLGRVVPSLSSVPCVSIHEMLCVSRRASVSALLLLPLADLVRLRNSGAPSLVSPSIR